MVSASESCADEPPDDGAAAAIGKLYVAKSRLLSAVKKQTALLKELQSAPSVYTTQTRQQVVHLSFDVVASMDGARCQVVRAHETEIGIVPVGRTIDSTSEATPATGTPTRITPASIDCSSKAPAGTSSQ